MCLCCIHDCGGCTLKLLDSSLLLQLAVRGGGVVAVRRPITAGGHTGGENCKKCIRFATRTGSYRPSCSTQKCRRLPGTEHHRCTRSSSRMLGWVQRRKERCTGSSLSRNRTWLLCHHPSGSRNRSGTWTAHRVSTETTTSAWKDTTHWICWHRPPAHHNIHMHSTPTPSLVRLKHGAGPAPTAPTTHRTCC